MPELGPDGTVNEDGFKGFIAVVGAPVVADPLGGFIAVATEPVVVVVEAVVAVVPPVAEELSPCERRVVS